MSAEQTDLPGGGTASSAGWPSEMQRLAATCRRQAQVIDTLCAGAKALKAENAELRAETARLRGHARSPARTDETLDGPELVDVAIPLGLRAPGIARGVVVQCLAGHVATPVVENARLLVSEMVTNSVRHSELPRGQHVIVRVHLRQDACCLEVEDPGSRGFVAPKPPDPSRGSGMGLNLVQLLSERWGLVRATDGPTRVWAQLALDPTLL